MCLAVLSLGQHPRFPVVLAANRDEFFARPTAPLAWWSPTGASTPILAGRDLSAGGTWFGLSARGRLALLTNVRDPRQQRPDAPSRGHIVPEWLSGDDSLAQAGARWQAAGYNGYNVIAADLAAGRWGWTSATGGPVELPAGLHGVSNASLDTPWPKVLQLRAALQSALAGPIDLLALVEHLLAALVDPTRAADATLPHTGVPLPVEQALSAVFIRTDDGRYGTRCSTVLVTERDAGGQRTHVFERTHAPDRSELAWAVLPHGPGAAATARVKRLAQPQPGYGTTLSSDWMNSLAD